MNRAFFLEVESARTMRVCDTQPIEVRASQTSDNTLLWDGHASVSDYSYTVYGGAPFGWAEKVQRGAYKRTLLNNADVSFLVNHEGMSLARTRSGTLTLLEDETGLRNVAELDMRQNAVNDLAIANERGDVNEQSMGFRVVADEWFDEDDAPSNRNVGTKRLITEINLNKGDVSAVNYGANDAAGGGFRTLDRAFAELRAGKPLTDDQRSLLRSFAAAVDETTHPASEPISVRLARLRELETI